MSEPAIELPPVRSDGLQLEEHRPFQEKVWTAERWAWIGFGLVVIAALLGVTGSGGYVSRGVLTLEGGEIAYPRVSRWVAADSLEITFDAGEAERSLILSPAFARTFQIEDIQPPPEHSQARPDGERMIFNVVAGAPATVHLHVRAQRPGIYRFGASIDGGARRNMTSIVLP